MRPPFIKRLDWYIMRKFLGTFLLSIVLVMAITIVFDLTEKLDKLTEHEAPLDKIIFEYYLNLLPYYFNMFSPLFVFISVIFFTSKLAGNSEIIAMQASGISFKRLLFPYFLTATLIAVFTFLFASYIIPPANKIRLAFENVYVKSYKQSYIDNVQMEVEKGVVLYLQEFDIQTKRGYNFSLERFDGKTLTSRLTARKVYWDTLTLWRVEDYTIRYFNGMKEEMVHSNGTLDTTINVIPTDLFVSIKEAPQMNNTELMAYIERQRTRGLGNIKAFESEYYTRIANSFAAYILTLIGVTLSARKVRGGTGANLGIGIALSAAYVLFSTFSTSFSVNGSMPAVLAAWLPNIVFAFIAAYLYTKAPK